MENLVKPNSSASDYLEIATIIEQFLDGTGSRWSWDDFIARRRFRNSYLQEIRLQCDLMPIHHPSDKVGQYCNSDGQRLMRAMVQELKTKAAEALVPEPGLGD